MSHETLIHQRGLTKRKVTNLIKKINQVTEKPDKSDFDVVCAEQYLNEIRSLDSQLQQKHVETSALVEPSNEEFKRILRSWTPTMNECGKT